MNKRHPLVHVLYLLKADIKINPVELLLRQNMSAGQGSVRIFLDIAANQAVNVGVLYFPSASKSY